MSWTVESAVPATAVKFADMPVGSQFSAYVTNVHNVPEKRIFVMVKNASNLSILQRLRAATTAPFAHKCPRFPREGIVFGIRYAGKANVLRAVRLPTVCLTTQREILLPDFGRKEIIDEKDALPEMYHLPIELRKPPGMAVCCQLQGINDDVTIVPDMLREVLPGLLCRSLTLRVDGFAGAVLKVQLLGLDLEVLKQWQSSINEEHKNSFTFVMEDFKLTTTTTTNEKENLPKLQETTKSSQPLLQNYDDENISSASSFDLTELFELGRQDEQQADCFVPLAHSSVIERAAKVPAAALRAVLGAKIERHVETPPRALLGRPAAVGSVESAAMRSAWKAWKHDSPAFAAMVDKRSRQHQCAEHAILVITPTHIGQLERFFGVIHEPGKPYLRHMWTDDEIAWCSRYVHGDRPLLFEIVLAKHCSDFNWYRAKVIEVLQHSKMVRVFFVDYGGDCYVKLKHLARLSAKIAALPFQATLFRLHALHDATASINEHALAVNTLRNLLLKETTLVRVVRSEPEQLVISFTVGPNKDIPDLMVRKGFMTASL